MKEKIIFIFFMLFMNIFCLFSQKAKIVISPSELTSQSPSVIRFDIYPPKEIKVGGMIIIDKLFKLFNASNDDSWKAIEVQRSDMKNGTEGAQVWIEKDKHMFLWSVNIKIEKRPLSQGEFVSFILGDYTNSFFASRKTSIVRVPVNFVYDPENKKETHLLDSNLKIRNSETVGLSAVGPSYAEIGKPVDITVSAYDDFGNVCEDYEEELVISVFSAEDTKNREHKKSYLMKAFDFKSDLYRNSFNLSFSSQGVYYVMVDDEKNKIHGISNPIKITHEKPKNSLYWGDIHIHTMISDGLGEPIDIYREGYSKGCDFCAVTDHNFGTRDRGTLLQRIIQSRNAAERFNHSGEYIAITGGEIHIFKDTHLNVYFDEANSEILGDLIDIFFPERNSGIYLIKNIKKLWKDLTSNYPKFPVVCTHHSLWMGNIDYLDDNRMRIVEIYSAHGSSEDRESVDIPVFYLGKNHLRFSTYKNFSVREALNTGKVLGFIANSDSHSGQPGNVALTAICASELSRDGILNALYNRSCFGTTGNRTIIELTVNGYPMGSIIPKEKTEKLDFAVFVAGDGLINRIDIIGNGKTVHSVDGKMKRVVSFQWEDEIPEFPAYYYLRVILEEGMAWSSPLWLR